MLAATIIAVFDACFATSERTLLRGGADEPLYRPWGADGSPAVVHFREDFPASALHEVAHWCIAGRRRRALVDYGYWYTPDGRDREQQRAFVHVEARPQALEWIFHEACASTFHLSVDNLAAAAEPDQAFAAAVRRQRRRFAAEGLPPRAARFRAALAERAGTHLVPGPGAPD